MTILIFITLLGWIPLTIALFAFLPPRRAVMVSVAGGYLVLPTASIPLSGLPDYDKMMAATVGIVIGTLIFQPNRLIEFRLHWFDLPILCWLVSPMLSSLQNGLGAYDGLSASFVTFFRWILPYFIGRLYLGDLEGLREFALAVVWGGLVYIPLIMLEMRLSPFIKGVVYGMYQWEGLRLGSYRPIVFLTTGLELGMWMTGVCLFAVWMWRCGALERIAGLSYGTFFVPVIVVITILCRSSGALVLLTVGLTVLWTSTRFNSKLPLIALLLVAPLYYGVRMSGLWTGDNLVSFVEQLNAERAQSLGFRFACENVLIQKAVEQPVFGWGGWGRSRVRDENGKDWAVTDGVWIIYLGNYGCFGLFSWTSLLLLPPWLFVLRFPVQQWKTPTGGPPALVATILGLYIIDCLLNGFINLLYVVGAGGLMCAYPVQSRRRPPIQVSEEHEQAARSLSFDPGGGQTENPLLLTESSTDSSGGENFLLSEPQVQLARRYRDLAKVLNNQGARPEATAAWVHALDLLSDVASKHPELPAALTRRCEYANDLAWFLINAPDPGVGDSELAVRLALQTTQARPETATYWNTLGAAYYCSGSQPEAIAALEKSVALTEGGTGFDYIYLILAHARLGHFEQARAWKTKADLWIQQHGTEQSDLCRLHSHACAYLQQQYETSTTTS